MRLFPLLLSPTLVRIALALILGVFASKGLQAQEVGAKSEKELSGNEASLSDRFDRLELLAGRLAEFSKATQPRRAELLQQLVASSREKDVHGRFAAIVEALKKDELGDATESQSTLHAELQAMLELLLQEDRDRQIESERQRISKYLAELNKIIRQQRGIKARTAGGDLQDELTEDQNRTTDSTGELGEKIESTEVTPKSASDAKGKEGKPKENSKDSKNDDGKKSSPSESGEQGKPNESKSGDSKPSDSKPGESQPSQSKPGESQQGDGKPSPSQGQPSESGQSGQPSDSESQPQEQTQTPSERAVEKLRKAQQRMQQAEEKLRESKREDSVEQQEAALRELEQAKAELEKILRQLREEELERMLVTLEARLRKMLELQNQVYDETKKLDESTSAVPEHELEIASASLSRKEDQIVGEVDRALVLLREDGTSVAYPEALQQAREDMVNVAGRLRRVKTDKITQALEEDIIATLEETLAAFQKALKELRDKRASQQQGGGEPGEQALVDQLAELRMIRALQMRVNGRTEFYDKLIKGDQTQEAELLEALDHLAERQEHIFEATRDLHQGNNQ